jgi:diadenosine tetraphosphatase ApaH/serine/threonine PP2A family protein phosphatase
VGYGANPNECVDLVRGRDITCLMGNHDREAVSEDDPISFNDEARAAILWTRGLLTAENAEFLTALPARKTVGRATMLCHGSPRSVDEYIFSASRASTVLAWLQVQAPTVRLLFFGHTHLQMYISTAPKDKVGDLSEPVRLQRNYIHLVNPGSVGQPRDGFRAASFLVYDSTQRTIEFRNVAYDVDKAAAKITAAGLPPSLAERIKIGV